MVSRTGEGPSRGGKLPLVTLFLLGALGLACLISVPGCGGCWQDSAAAKKKKEEEEEKEKEKKKKKKAEKPKDDFEPLVPRVLPSNDPTLADKNPILRIKTGHWAALSEATKANNFDYLGELETFAAGIQPIPLEIENTNSRLSVWRPASLPKGQGKTFETLVFFPKRPPEAGYGYSLRCQLRGPRGGPVAMVPTAVPLSSLKEYEHLIVVLASNPAAYIGYDKLHAVRMPSVEAYNSEPLQYYYVLRPNAEKRVPLPSHPLAWTTVAYVFWDDINPAVLTQDQQDALLDWLHFGGQLVISGPNSLDKLKGSFLSPYLPAETAETIKLDQTAFDEINATWSLKEVKKQSTLRTINIIAERPMVGVSFKRHAEARDVAGTGGLVVERRTGGGRIVVTAFPLTDVRIRQWKNFDNFFNGALLRRPARQFSSDEFNSLRVNWADRQLYSMTLEPRLGSTLRYFSRDIGYLSEDKRPESAYTPLPAPNDMTENIPGMPAGAPASVRRALMAQLGQIPTEVKPPDTTGQHPDIDDWHFAGYHASPQSGVAAWSDYGAASDAARKALTEAAGIEIPRADFVLKVLAAYLAVLVPLNWLIFRVINRVEWAWIAAPIIAVVGAAAVIRLAQLDIGFARNRTEIAVLEVQSGYERAHLTRYTALYSSLTSTYRLAFDQHTALALPFASASGETTSQQISSKSDVQLRQDKDTSLAGVQVSSNSTGMVHSEQMFDLGGKLTLVGDDQKGFSIKNTGSLALADVGILRRNASGRLESAYVAKLNAQTTAPLSFAPLTGDSPWLPEWDKSPVLSRQDTSEKGRVRLTRLARLAVERLRIMPGDMRLVAWTDQALEGLTISPHAPQNNTHTLVLAHLSRGNLPAVRPDANVAEDYYEPEIEPDPSTPDPTETTSGS
jgi:hypothetical protein